MSPGIGARRRGGKEGLEQARGRYCQRGREGRSRLLDEVCELCGYERKYASKDFCHGQASGCRQPKAWRLAAPIYGVAEREVIKAIWLAAEQPCGKQVEGGAEGMATTLREAARTLGSGVAAKSNRNKRIEHRPVVGPLPGEPGSASSLKACETLDKEQSTALENLYHTLDPFALKVAIETKLRAVLRYQIRTSLFKAA